MFNILSVRRTMQSKNYRIDGAKLKKNADRPKFLGYSASICDE